MFSFRCNKISETEISEALADQSGRDSELIMQSRTPVCRNVSAVWDPDAKQSGTKFLNRIPFGEGTPKI